MDSRKVVVIAGPTGSGETTVTNEIVRRFPKRVARLVTATTRAPRSGEKHGIDYYFFAPEEFTTLDEKGDILEKTYIANRDTYYGTLASDLNDKIASGKIIIVNPDIVGARFYKENFGATTIFIVPETINALEHRIRERNPELPDEEIAKRRENARSEIRDEESFYDYKVMNVDGKFEKTVDEVLAILKKEGYNL